MAASPPPAARPVPPAPSTPPGPPSRAGALGRTGWLLLLAACAAPHAVRWMLPHVAATDGAFAHSAFMISRGYSPYVQFAHVAFPFAEQALAVVLLLAGTSLRVVEAANLAVVLGVAAVLAAAGQRLAGRTAGVVAALAWSGSVWVVHFHLFEPETWAAAGGSLALLVCARRQPFSRGASLRLALALLAAVTVKLTAFTVVAGVGLHLLVTGRRAALLRVALLFAAGFLLLTLLCWWLWGEPFLVQVFLFGFFRNGPARTLYASFTTLLRWSDPALAAGLIALIVRGLPRLRAPEGAAALVLLCELAYLLSWNPVERAHNLISLMPPAALLAGCLLADLRRPGTALAASAVGAALLAGISWSSTVEGGYMPGRYGDLPPGLGGDERADLERHAEFIRRHSRADDVVLTGQPWWSFAAGRVEFVRYVDIQEVTEGIVASLHGDGLAATWARRQGPLLLGPGDPPPDPRVRREVAAGVASGYAGRLAANALAYIQPRLLEALQQHEIALVVEPRVIASEGQLRTAGYERFVDGDLGVAGWRPRDGVSRPVVRDLFPR